MLIAEALPFLWHAATTMSYERKRPIAAPDAKTRPGGGRPLCREKSGRAADGARDIGETFCYICD